MSTIIRRNKSKVAIGATSKLLLLHTFCIALAKFSQATTTTTISDYAREIQLAKQSSKIESLEEFFEFYNSPDKLSLRSSGSSFDNDDFQKSMIMQRSSNAIVAKPALCKPESQIVPVKEEFDPTYHYFTRCTRVKRCGGCCNSDRLACEPTSTEMVNYELNLVHGVTNESSKEIVPIEIHTACACKCAIKAKDCTRKHFYNETECRCVCKSTDEESKCSTQTSNKFWDADDCSCKCREAKECATGFYYDQKLCRCLSISKPAWFSPDYYKSTSNNAGNYYNVRPPPPSVSRPANGNNRNSNRQKDYNTSPQIVFFPDANDPRRRHREDPEY